MKSNIRSSRIARTKSYTVYGTLPAGQCFSFILRGKTSRGVKGKAQRMYPTATIQIGA